MFSDIKLTKENIIQIWDFFSEDEKVFFYNPLESQYIIGAKKSKKRAEKPPFTFYPMHFFDGSQLASTTRYAQNPHHQSTSNNTKENPWFDIDKEGICFDFCLLIEMGKIEYCNFTESLLEEIKTKIHKSDTLPTKHSFIQEEENPKNWESLFHAIMDNINKNEVEKVVASRKVKLVCDEPVRINHVLTRLLEKNQNCFVFAYTKDNKTFLGASPELLVEKKGINIRSYALAGTIKKDDTNANEQGQLLLNDTKNQYEHALVVENIAALMESANVPSFQTNDSPSFQTSDACSFPSPLYKSYSCGHSSLSSLLPSSHSDTSKNPPVVIGKTELMELKNLFHLRTDISIKNDTLTLVEWAKRLHPSPAMGGKPREKALEIIAQNETHERGMYAAPLGFVFGNGDGLFVVGIRSALIDKNIVHAYVGCGIVKNSNCQAEFEETNNKLQTLIECL